MKTKEEIIEDRKKRLIESRKLAGYTLAQVASKIGVNHSTYSRWESGTTSTMRYPDLLALSKLFDVNQEWLYGYDVPKCDKQQIIKEKREQLSQILLKIPDDDLDRVYQMIKLMLGKDDSK